MGDVVMASPLAEGLRHVYPTAHIYWLAEPQVSPLLDHNPALSGVLVWPKQHWKSLVRGKKILTLLKEVRIFVGKLRGYQFDMVIDAQGLLRTRLLAWASGASQRIGFVSKEPGGFLMTRLITKGDATQGMGSEYFHLLTQIGVNTAGLGQSVHLASESYDAASRLLAEAGINGSYVVFAPFTTRPQKHWFEQRWIQLAIDVREMTGLPVVWLGGPADQQAAESLASRGGGVSFAGKASLGTSAALVAKSALLVGVDTGLTHLGTASHIPTVALFGSTCPYTETCNPTTVVLYHALPCSPCRRNPTCDERYDCMQALTVEEIHNVIRKMYRPGVPI